LKDIKENGENDNSLVLLAEIHLKKSEIVEAENLYKKAQKINPRSYEALVGLADISTKRNNFELALDLYKKAMNQKSDEPILHKKVGDVYRLLGQGALAMESYKMYLEMAPEASDKAQVETYINIMK
jgi:tetratricopeptide (TPR) repeat protein